MSKRTAAATAFDGGFDGLRIGKTTLFGLVVAAFGWAMLLGETIVASGIVTKVPRPPVPHADVLEIAKCIVASGFALALVGALQTGFGTLNRFFGAVLMRSARRDVEPSHASVAERPRAAATPAAPLEQRPYRLFPDGSVEVETILGSRVFKSMTEARDFI